MFTFCFTSVAAAQLRRTRETTKSTRQVAVRTVKFGVLAAAVLAMASVAQAHMPGGLSGLSGMSSHNSGGSNFFSQAQSKMSNAVSNKFESHKISDLGNVKKDKTSLSDNVKGAMDKVTKTTGKKIDDIKLASDKTDKMKTGLSDKLKVGSSDKIKNVLGDKIKNISSDKGKTNLGGMLKTMSGSKMGKIKLCDLSHKHCCPWWYCWNYPCWTTLYGCSCGCYDDVPVVQVPQGLDLQLLAVRSLDSGDPEQKQGPAVRVWFRNNSEVAINHPFNVLALAARDAQPSADLPQAGVRVESIEAGQTMAVDIRLPVEANEPGLPMFHVLVDSHREIPEINEANNGIVINRADVQPVEIAETTPSDNTPVTGGTQNPPAPPAEVEKTTEDAPVTTTTPSLGDFDTE
jgi:hypothetical protein